MFLLISDAQASQPTLQFELSFGQPYMVGRAPEAHCRLPLGDQLISRYHATLEVCLDGVFVRDLQSRNGTFINDHKVTSALLRPGDRLRLGADPAPGEHDSDRLDHTMRDLPKMELSPAVSPVAPPPLPRCEGCGAIRDALFSDPFMGAGWLCNDCALIRREPAPGQPETMAGYQIIRIAGRGGMGVVYEARHRETQAHVALKVLQPVVPLSPLLVRRFLKEQRLAVSLQHPRIVRCYEVGQDASSQQLYMASEWLPAGDASQIGDQVSDRLERVEQAERVGQGGQASGEDKSDFAVAVTLGGDLFEALGYLHALGFVHRDIKPDNLLLARPPAGEPGPTRGKVGDFGIIKDFREGASLTADSDVCGTPLFMAPEQLSANSRLGPSVDIYAGGATLYFLLTGQTMLSLPGDRMSTDVATTLNAIMDTRRIPIGERRADIPKVIAGWIDRAVSRDFAAREGMRAIEIADLLRRWLPSD